MTLRTEGQIVLASNMAQDLTNLVVAYLNLYREHAQGLNGVHVPTKPFTVIFSKIMKEGVLPVKLVYTDTTMWEEPNYYDVDSDYFSESLGASNIYGYSSYTENHQEEYDISIPVSLLLLTKEGMEKQVKEFAQRKKREAAEKMRLEKIAEYEDAIERLKENL